MDDNPQTKLQAILDSPPDLVIFALDRDYRYLAFNENHRQTMAQIWNADIDVGLDMLTVIGRDDDRERARRNFDRALAGEAFTLIEAYGDEKQGERRYYRDAYAPILDGDDVIGLTVFLSDVTDQRRVELELQDLQRHLEALATQRTVEMLHAQKLESLGVLAGGIAHDFNNILAVIMGAADLAELHLHRPEQLAVEIDRIQRGARRAAELTNQMLSYAGRAERRVETVDLDVLIREMVDLLGSTVSGRARIEIDIDPETPNVVADAGQIRQVVLNLLTNASDAVGDGGRIVVRTVPATRLSIRCALLEVEDDGVGMDADTVARIFDPFFSTKVQGRGLGLAAVQGIVTAHEGHLEVQSQPGEGSTFRLWLPVTNGEVADGDSHPPVDPERLPTHVLVVDDEPEVLKVCELMLRSLGIRVSTAHDGTEALLLLQRDPSIDFLLLDLTTPGPRPEETLAAVHECRPDVRTVVFSGYDEHEVRGRLGEPTRFLRKPFKRAELLAALDLD